MFAGGGDFEAAAGAVGGFPVLPPFAVKEEKAEPEERDGGSWLWEGVLPAVFVFEVFEVVLFLVTAATWVSRWGGEGRAEESGSREGAGAGADADAGGDCDSEENNDPERLSGAPAANGVWLWADLRIDVGLGCCCFCCRFSLCAEDAAGFREGGDSGETGVTGKAVSVSWRGLVAEGKSGGGAPDL